MSEAGAYVVALACDSNGESPSGDPESPQRIAASVAGAADNGSVEVLDAADLRCLRTLTRHPGGAPEDLVFLSGAGGTKGCLLTSSADGTARLWDLRVSGAAAQRVLRPTFGSGDPAVSVTADTDGLLCACATGNQIHVFDLTAGTELFVHAEAHCEPVSRVRFHPYRAHELVSSGSDGLLCAIDVRRCRDRLEDEDDAGLRVVVNSEEDVRALSFAGEGADLLCAISTTEVLQLWSLHERRLGAMCGRFPDLRADRRLRVGESDGYIVGVLYDRPSGHADVLAGDVAGGLALFHLNLEVADFTGPLPKGHNGIVRATEQLGGAGRHFATGGEDGVVCVWRPEAAALGAPAAPAARQPSPTAAAGRASSGHPRPRRAARRAARSRSRRR